MSSELLDALDAIEEERGIDKEILIDAIEVALVSVYRKNYDPNPNIKINFDRETGEINVFGSKTVVEEIYDEASEITLEEARKIDENVNIGDSVDYKITPKSFGRIAAQMAKQVVIQRIREAERGIIYNEYIEKESEIITGTVRRIERNTAFVELGKVEGILGANEMIPGERLTPGKRIKVYVLSVRNSSKGPQVILSRTHPFLVKRMFEVEVPEIRSGVVQIKSIAREAGYRTKIAVFSNDPDVDSLGACVGHKGIRVEMIVNELGGEKIDVIRYSENPVEFISNSLSPAKVLFVRVNEEDKIAKVVVPDNQLSLAIGKEGQNARLAAKLTGWKIDIKSESEADFGDDADYEESEELEFEEQETLKDDSADVPVIDEDDVIKDIDDIEIDDDILDEIDEDM